MKTCSQCLAEKELDDFYLNRSAEDGHTARCKECLYTRSLPTREEILRAGEKRCSVCRKTKPLHLFVREGDGLWFTAACRACIYRKRHSHHKSERELQNSVKEIEWRIGKKAAGLCTRCGKKPLTSGASCDDCIKKRNSKRITEGEQRRLAGLCDKCGKVPRTHRSLCERCHEVMQKHKRKLEHELRTKVLDYFGNKCSCCGESHRAFLNIDHINGGGRLERARIKMYKQILLGKRLDLRLLCWNCNLGREQNGGTCPHEELRK